MATFRIPLHFDILNAVLCDYIQELYTFKIGPFFWLTLYIQYCAVLWQRDDVARFCVWKV